MSRTTFEVYDCQPTNPPDSAKYGYMQAVFSPCYVPGSLQMQLFPWSFLTLFAYTICYPVSVIYILTKVWCLAVECQRPWRHLELD